MKIPLDQLIANPDNRAINTDKVQEYAASIRLNGLLQDPLVKQIDEEIYMIISGHHRVEAYRILAKEEFKYNCIDCKVMQSDMDPKYAEIALIDGNLNTPLTSYEKVMAIGKKEALLKELAKDHAGEYGKGFGTLRNIIAEQSSFLKATQVGKYLRIYKRAVPEVLEKLKKDQITVEQAAKIVLCEPEEQIKQLYMSLHQEQPHANVFITELRQRMQKKLDTQVCFKKNKFEIYFGDIEDLNRILEVLHLLEEEL